MIYTNGVLAFPTNFWMSNVFAGTNMVLRYSSNAVWIDLTNAITGQTNFVLKTNGNSYGMTENTSLTMLNATASRVTVFDGSQKLTNSNVTLTELLYLSGVTNIILTASPSLNLTNLGVQFSLTLSNVTPSRMAVFDANKALTNGALAEAQIATTNYVNTNSPAPQYHIGTATFERWHALGMNGNSGSLSTGVVFTNGNHRMIAFYSGRGGVIDYMGATIVTAVALSTFHLEIYETISATNIFPGNLLVDSGSLSGTLAVGVSNAVSAVLLPNRIYWAGAHASAAIAIRSLNIGAMDSIIGFSKNMENGPTCSMESISTYGNSPATFPLTNVLFNANSSTLNPCVFVRFSNTVP